jgi:predicted alpha/beta hydrolase family esterase
VAQTPEMPRAYQPDFAEWSREFERFDVGPESSLVGHSWGAGFIVRWLSEHPEVTVGTVVLVAPWIDPDQEDKNGLAGFEIDPALASRTSKLVIFHSDNDKESIQKSVPILRDKIANHKYVEFHNYGHFCWKDMQDNAFPELLEELLT